MSRVGRSSSVVAIAPPTDDALEISGGAPKLDSNLQRRERSRSLSTTSPIPQLQSVSAIPSRFVEELRALLDPAAQQAHVLRGFRESLHIVRTHAQAVFNGEEDRLLVALDALGATRHRAAAGSMQEARSERAEAERQAAHFETVLGLVNQLTVELEEHVGLFTDKFVAAMSQVTHEVKTADWDIPGRDPWSQIPSLTPALLRLASEAPTAAADRNPLLIDHSYSWSAEPAFYVAPHELTPPASALQSACRTPAAGSTAEPVTPGATRFAPVPSGSTSAALPSLAISATPPVGPAPPGASASIPPTPSAAAILTSGQELAQAPATLAKVRKQELLVQERPSLHITCMCVEKADSQVGKDGHPASSWLTVFVGAKNGAVLGLPPTALKEEPVAVEEEAGSNSTSFPTPDSRRATPQSKRATPQGFASTMRAGTPPLGATMGSTTRRRKKVVANVTEVPSTGPYKDLTGVSVYSGHLYPVTSIHAFEHKGTRMVASASEDKTVRVSNIATREIFFVFAENRAMISSLVYHCRLGRLVVGQLDGSIELWNPRYGGGSVLIPPGTAGPVHTVAVSDNYLPTKTAVAMAEAGTGPLGPMPRLYVGTRAGALFELHPVLRDETGLRDPVSVVCHGAFLPPRNGQLPLAFPVETEERVSREGHSAPITCITTPHYPFVFSGDGSGVVHHYDAEKMKRLRVMRGHVDVISGIQVSSDGYLFSSSFDATVVAWSWRDGVQLQRLTMHFNRVTGIALGTMPKDRVDVASLIASSAKMMKQRQQIEGRSGGAAAGDELSLDQWPGGQTLAMRYVPGVVECTILAASTDQTISVSTATFEA